MHIDHVDERLRLGEELLALAKQFGEPELEALAHHWRIYDLLEAARVDEAAHAHRRLATLAAELRQPLYSHFSVGWEVVWARWRAASRTPSGWRARASSSGAAPGPRRR